MSKLIKKSIALLLMCVMLLSLCACASSDKTEAVSVTATEIADILGFYSTEQLCKFFRYHEGISINEYKRRIKL